MSAKVDVEALELRANEQRRRVAALIEALDARRHPRPGTPKHSPWAIAALLLSSLGLAGLVAGRTRRWSPATRRTLTGLAAATGTAGVALGATAAARAVFARRPTALAAVNGPRRVQLEAEPAAPTLVQPVKVLEAGAAVAAVAHARAEQGATKRRHRRWPWIVLATLVVLFIAGRIALDPLAGHFLQKGLDEGLTGYHGTFSKVHVSIVPLELSIDGLRLVQDGMEVKDQTLFVKHLNASAAWGDLLTGKIAATAKFDHAAFRVLYGQTEAPPEAREAAEKANEKLKEKNLDMGQVLHETIPFRVERVEMKDSEVTLIDATDPKRPAIWLNDIELVMENLVSREKLDQDAPMMITARATVQKSGVLKMLFVADLLDTKPAFTGQAQLTGLNLESLYEWAASKAGVSPHGTLNVFVNANSGKGALKGDVKVVGRKIHVDGLETVGDKLKALGANIAFKVLANDKGTVGTTLPLRGSLQNPDPQVWPTILGVVRNAFVDAIDWGFGDLPVDTADKKQGIIQQAVEGLDKKKDGPEAQPTGGGK